MVERDKKETKYFVTLSNEWFYTGRDNPEKEKFISLARKYGSKGFLLLIKILQSRTSRNKYSICSHDIDEWFNYSKKKYTEGALKLLFDFQKEKIIKLNQDYVVKDLLIKNLYLTPENKFEYGFFSIYDYEVDKIMNGYSGNSDKAKLLLLFGCIKSHYNTETKICYPTIKTISLETGMTDRTIIEGIDILSDLGLILYNNLGTKLYSDGKIREFENVYTMNYKGNDEVLEQYIKEQKELVVQTIVVRNTANKRRSLKMKQRHLKYRYEEGKITKEEYDKTKDALEDEHKKLLEQEFNTTLL